MSSRLKDWSFRVVDMLKCIEHIESLTAGLEEDAFYSNLDVYRATERNFEIIAEASKHIPSHIKAEHPEISWPDIVGMRNVIVHNYDSVDQSILWHAVLKNVPALKSVLTSIHEKYGGME